MVVGIIIVELTMLDSTSLVATCFCSWNYGFELKNVLMLYLNQKHN